MTVGGRPITCNFDDHFPDEKRIDQVIAWLRLPAAQRPHFITLYYSNVDHAGHQYGPDSPQTAAAVQHVDQLVGDLWAELARLQLPVDLIVVSDHGMEREQGPWIDLDQYADLKNFITVGSLLYPNSEAAAEKAYQELKIKSDAFTVYRRRRVPAALHYDSNAREGDPVVVANGPYAIRAQVRRRRSRLRSGRARLRSAGDEVHACPLPRRGPGYPSRLHARTLRKHKCLSAGGKDPGLGRPQGRWQPERPLQDPESNAK